MRLIYIDESHELPPYHVYAALAIDHTEWRACFTAIRDFRRSLRRTDGIYIRKELHAWKFVSGRGDISQVTVTKSRRCTIFRDALLLATRLPSAKLFTCVDPDNVRAFERLLNRINRTMQEWHDYALLICDQGNEVTFRKLVRRMGVFNPIPSKYGVWLDTGQPTRNIPLERIIEDPFFKTSEHSYFLQLADFCAYALLRKDRQLATKNRYGLHTAFALLRPICVRAAHPADPYGTIR